MLSVMVMGAGAAFSDQDKIENTEAVDATTALNIISGYEDGSFHPERNIKRSEVTKMICVALNGGKEPNLSVPNTPTFSDVRGTADGWAEKYIESCVAQGIVSGVGGGRFAPAGNVTGSQLAKMLLVALGYDAELGQFTGTAWETNVNVVATQKGLYEGLETMDVSAAVTRDQAAQMVWNALQASMVTYKYTLVSENGQLVSKVELVDRFDTNNNKLTLLKDAYNVVKVEGIVLSNESASLNGSAVELEGKTYVQVTNSSQCRINSGLFEVSSDFNMLGKDVILFAQPANNSTAANKATVIGNIMEGDNTVVTINTAHDADEWADLLKDNGLKVDGSTQYANNYDALTTGTVNNTFTGNGQTVTLIDNDGDGVVNYALKVTNTLSKITSKDDTNEKMVISGVGTVDYDDATGYQDLKKDDMILYFQADGVTNMKAVKTVEGQVSSFVTTAGSESNTIDGVKYGKSALTGAVLSGLTYNIINTASDTTGTYRFYLDDADCIIAYEVVDEAVGTYAVALETGITTNAALDSDAKGEIKVLYTDANTTTLSIDMLSSAIEFKTEIANATDVTYDGTNDVTTGNFDSLTDAQKVAAFAQYIGKTSQNVFASGTHKTGKNLMAGSIISVSEGDDGYILAPVDSFQSKDNIVKGTNSATNSAGDITAILNSDTIFLYNNNDKYTAVKGVNNLSATAAEEKGIVAYVPSTKVAQVVYIVGTPGTSTANHAYITGNPSVTYEGGTTYVSYDGYDVNGQLVTLTVKNGGASTSYKGQFVSYTLDSNNYATITPGTLDANGTFNNTDSTAYEYIKGNILTLRGDVVGIAIGGTEYFYNVSGITPYTIEDTDAVAATEFSEGQQVAISTKYEDGEWVIEGALVLKEVGDTYSVVINGKNIGLFAEGETVTIDFTDEGFGDVGTGNTSDIVVTGTTTSVTRNTTDVSFVMEDEDVAVTTKYALTITKTSASNATVFTDPTDPTSTEVSSGDLVAANTVLYASSNSTTDAQEGLTATGVTLSVYTAGADQATSAVYTFMMPAATTSATFTYADIGA